MMRCCWCGDETPDGDGMGFCPKPKCAEHGRVRERQWQRYQTHPECSRCECDRCVAERGARMVDRIFTDRAEAFRALAGFAQSGIGALCERLPSAPRQWPTIAHEPRDGCECERCRSR